MDTEGTTGVRQNSATVPPLSVVHFIHGVELDDWYPCWNLALSGRLSSPDYFAAIEPGFAAVHRRIRDTPLEELRARGLPGGVPTPRAVWCVFAAAIARNGGRVGIGMINTRWFSTEEADNYRKRGDIEIAFEEGRRSIAPEALLACQACMSPKTPRPDVRTFDRCSASISTYCV